MAADTVSTLLQGGIVGLFIIFSVYQSRIHNENQVRWQEFQGRQFEMLNETSRQLTAVLTEYSRAFAELTREIRANTEAIKELSSQRK